MLGGMMQLCLTDHIIVGDSDFFSFRQAGADLRKENNMVPIAHTESISERAISKSTVFPTIQS